MIELDYQGCKNFWNLVSSEAILITSKPKRRNLFHLHLAYARAHLTTCNTNSSLKNVSQNHWLEKQPKPQASFSSYSNRECFFISFFHSPPPVLTLCTPKRTHIKKKICMNNNCHCTLYNVLHYALYIWCSYCFAPVPCSEGLKSHLCIHKHAHCTLTSHPKENF